MICSIHWCVFYFRLSHRPLLAALNNQFIIHWCRWCISNVCVRGIAVFYYCRCVVFVYSILQCVGVSIFAAGHCGVARQLRWRQMVRLHSLRIPFWGTKTSAFVIVSVHYLPSLTRLNHAVVVIRHCEYLKCNYSTFLHFSLMRTDYWSWEA